MNITELALHDPDGGVVTLGALTYPSGNAYGFTIEEVNLSPGERGVSRLSTPLVQGASVTPGRTGAREITVRGLIVGSTKADTDDLAQDLIQVTRDHGFDPLTAWFNNGQADVQVYCYLEGKVNITAAGGHYLAYDFMLVAGDPVSYSRTPLSLTAANSVLCGNIGTANVYPVITATWSGGTSFTISATTGRALTFTGMPAAGTIVIDCIPGYESADGYLDKLTAGSRFIEIPPGGTTITAIPPGGGTASAIIEYAEGWLL